MDCNDFVTFRSGVTAVPATVILAVALTVLAPALCVLEARQVYRAGLFTVTLRMDRITSPTKVSSTDAPEIWKGKEKTAGMHEKRDDTDSKMLFL